MLSLCDRSGYWLIILTSSILGLPAQVPFAVASEGPVTIRVPYSRMPVSERISFPVTPTAARRDIERMQPAISIDVLQSLPGVDALRAGGEGGLSFVSIRGGEPNFTLFLLNGIKLNDPTNSRGGGVDLSIIPQHLIDTIEVSPRPASAIHGGDGLSGIVNIRTKPVSGVRLHGDMSSEGSGSVSGAFGGEVSDSVRGSLTVGRDDKTTGVEGDHLRQSYLLGHSVLELHGEGSVDLIYFDVDGEAGSFPEDSGGDRLAVIRTPETRDYRRQLLGSTAEWGMADDLSLSASLNWTRHREQVDNPGIAPGVLPGVPGLASDRSYKRTDGQIYLLARPTDGFSVTAGAAYERESGSSEDLIDFGGVTLPANFQLERSAWSLFGEFSYRPSPLLTLQAGMRRDMPDSAGDETSLNLGAAYLIPQIDTTFSVYYGQGYKLPSIFALGHSLVGNPDLLPEDSESLEFGVRKYWQSLGVETELAVFASRYRDLIDFDPLLFTNVNRGLVEVRGVNLDVEWSISPGVTVGSYMSYNDAEIVDSNARLRRRPAWKGGVDVTWLPFDGLSWTASADFTGRYYDSSIPTGMIEMPGFWRVNTAVVWQYTDNVQWSLSIKNLLDDDYEESVGFSNGGVTAILGLELRI